MSNIYEIAKKVGLSPSTVARALSGRGYCSEESRKKVLEAAKEVNYSPTHAAKTLKSKRTNKILFCIPDIYNPFYFGMIKGANDVLEKYGYYTLLCYTKHNIEEELKMIEALREKYGDGMIFVSFNFCEKNISAVNASKMPVVLTNRYDSPRGEDYFDYVYIDTYKGVQLATRHLVDQGHRKIAFIGGNLEEQTSFERYSGWKDELINSGLDPDDSLVYEGDYTIDSGYACAEKIVKSSNVPTGIVAANDLMAIGFIRYCGDNGIKIPHDFAVAGMDNTDFSSVLKLTSVDMRQEEIGLNAASLLMERVLGGRTYKKTIRIEPRLVVRESSITNK
ncbi:MAG TPA: LacI family transcriptional regulator [Clostridiales bacterium]|nr:LacI family transcriptional regulator [Clostridiales bacterium]